MFDDMIENIKRHCQVVGSDKIRMTISHPGLKLGVFITWRDVSALTGEIITQEIEKVMQSNDKFKINDGQMRMDVTVCRLPTGAGRKPLHHGLYFESDNLRKNKMCIVQINNANDVMCMARAVVVGKCHADKDESETWKKTWKHIQKSDRPLQTREAKQLLDQANIPHDTVCGIEEYKKILFQSPRDKMQIKVLSNQLQAPHMIPAFNDATSKPHGYLLVDLKPTTPNDLRFRTDIFQHWFTKSDQTGPVVYFTTV